MNNILLNQFFVITRSLQGNCTFWGVLITQHIQDAALRGSLLQQLPSFVFILYFVLSFCKP